MANMQTYKDFTLMVKDGRVKYQKTSGWRELGGISSSNSIKYEDISVDGDYLLVTYELDRGYSGQHSRNVDKYELSVLPSNKDWLTAKLIKNISHEDIKKEVIKEAPKETPSYTTKVENITPKKEEVVEEKEEEDQCEYCKNISPISQMKRFYAEYYHHNCWNEYENSDEGKKEIPQKKAYYEELIAKREKERREKRNQENNLWITSTHEGKMFAENCKIADPEQREEAIAIAMRDYYLTLHDLQGKLRVTEEKFIKKFKYYFSEKECDKIKKALMDIGTKCLNGEKELEDCKKLKSVYELQFEKIPQKHKVRHAIRIYADIVIAVIFGGAGFGYIGEHNVKNAVIFFAIALLFISSPVLGRFITKKQTETITAKNITKIKEILGADFSV